MRISPYQSPCPLSFTYLNRWARRVRNFGRIVRLALSLANSKLSVIAATKLTHVIGSATNIEPRTLKEDHKQKTLKHHLKDIM